MSKRTDLTPKTMWICIADGKYYDWNSLDSTRRGSIDKEVQRACRELAPDYDWQALRRFGYKCIKVTVKIEIE